MSDICTEKYYYEVISIVFFAVYFLLPSERAN
jgi:hypothetical protein